MIELIYNEEEASVVPEKKLSEPKNVKQVGEPREYKKIFMEDFVHTYLLQYSASRGQKIGIAVLIGNSERAGGKRHLYITGALPLQEVSEKHGKYCFTEKIWGDIYQECERYFPGQEIMGWFLSRPGFAPLQNVVMEETHRTYFSGADKVLFVTEPVEGESTFFGFDGNRFARQSGYYIYYEKNEAMRELIMEKNKEGEQTSRNEKPDVAMANFRKILKEKQEQNEKRKKKAVSYGTKIAAVMILFVGAVALKNHSDTFEISGQSVFAPQEAEQIEETSGEDVLIEELPGNVEELPVETYEVQEQLSVNEEETTEQQETEETVVKIPTYEEYIVQKGDTLAKISREFYGTDEKVSEICSMNGITDGDYIQAGEIILLP